jgi:hypothetical protein
MAFCGAHVVGQLAGWQENCLTSLQRKVQSSAAVSPGAGLPRFTAALGSAADN